MKVMFQTYSNSNPYATRVNQNQKQTQSSQVSFTAGTSSARKIVTSAEKIKENLRSALQGVARRWADKDSQMLREELYIRATAAHNSSSAEDFFERLDPRFTTADLVDGLVRHLDPQACIDKLILSKGRKSLLTEKERESIALIDLHPSRNYPDYKTKEEATADLLHNLNCLSKRLLSKENPLSKEKSLSVFKEIAGTMKQLDVILFEERKELSAYDRIVRGLKPEHYMPFESK